MHTTAPRLIVKTLALGLALSGLASTALAGAKLTRNVSINTGTGRATGNLGSARSSSDTTQYIGCEIRATGSTVLVNCFAKTSSGTTLSCSTIDAQYEYGQIEAVASIGPGSYIEFTAGIGGCENIVVSNDSRHKPIAP